VIPAHCVWAGLEWWCSYLHLTRRRDYSHVPPCVARFTFLEDRLGCWLFEWLADNRGSRRQVGDYFSSTVVPRTTTIVMETESNRCTGEIFSGRIKRGYWWIGWEGSGLGVEEEKSRVTSGFGLEHLSLLLLLFVLFLRQHLTM
jgi:hypothetical protein